MAKALIYAHFDFQDVIDDYVVEGLKIYALFFDRIIFVSASNLSISETSKLQLSPKDIVIRDNVGYDFQSYKVGFELLACDIENYSRIFFCNDSVYGPFNKLLFSNMLAKMSHCDFWGVTINREIYPHVQSYFFSVSTKKSVLVPLEAFFRNLSVLETKSEVILQGEIGLSQALRDSGIKMCGYFWGSRLAYIGKKKFNLPDNSEIFRKITNTLYLVLKEARFWIISIFRKRSSFKRNPTVYQWQEMVDAGCPFIKIELARKGMVSNNYYATFLKHNTDFDVNIVQAHLKRTLLYYRSM